MKLSDLKDNNKISEGVEYVINFENMDRRRGEN